MLGCYYVPSYDISSWKQLILQINGVGFGSRLLMSLPLASVAGKNVFAGWSRFFKGTVAPVSSRLKVVWINTVESGEVPLVETTCKFANGW
jgi:hypothetical protein